MVTSFSFRVSQCDAHVPLSIHLLSTKYSLGRRTEDERPTPARVVDNAWDGIGARSRRSLANLMRIGESVFGCSQPDYRFAVHHPLR